MNILIIDCSEGMSLYLCKGLEEFVYIDKDQKKHTDELLVSLDKILKKANLKIKDINYIGVCKGPGSFTGIRVAISICKGLVVESEIKVVELSNFDVMDFGSEENAYYVLEGFSNYIYVRKNINGVKTDSCENINNFVKKFIQKNENLPIYVLTEKMQNTLNLYKILSKIVKNNTVLYVKDKINKNLFIQINSIEPVYLRASQAEIERDRKLLSEKR